MSIFVDSPGAMLGFTRFGEKFTRGSFDKISSNICQNYEYGLDLCKQLKKDGFHAMETVFGLVKNN